MHHYNTKLIGGWWKNRYQYHSFQHWCDIAGISSGGYHHKLKKFKGDFNAMLKSMEPPGWREKDKFLYGIR